MKLSEREKESLQIVKELLEELDKHYTMIDLVRKSGMNSDKLKKGFKQLYGVAMHEYHVEFKMVAAKKMLTSTSMSRDEIAELLGYNDGSNFSAQFKKIHGVTINEWKKTNNKNQSRCQTCYYQIWKKN